MHIRATDLSDNLPVVPHPLAHFYASPIMADDCEESCLVLKVCLKKFLLAIIGPTNIMITMAHIYACK